MEKQNSGFLPIASNRKAYHDYFVLETYEAGIELYGTEIKSIRGGRVNLKDSFCSVDNGEMFVIGMHIYRLMSMAIFLTVIRCARKSF